jgi:hypothetical protein
LESTGTAKTFIASMSAAVVPGGSSTVVAAGMSRWIDQSGMSWLEVYHLWSPFSLTAMAVPTQLPGAGGVA